MSLSWVPHPHGHQLAIMGRPRAGDWLEDEIERWREAGVGIVVSLLEPEEVRDLELQRESELCQAKGIDFRSFPIPDRGIPASSADARLLAEAIARHGTEGVAVAIHCRAGIGRSSLMAALVLILAGMNSADALAAIGQARGLTVPDTDVQRAWPRTFEQGYHLP